MLYNIILAVMAPFCVWCFYAGFKLGKSERMPAVKFETPAKKKAARERTEESRRQLERFNALQRNLENYKGNGEGQIKI